MKKPTVEVPKNAVHKDMKGRKLTMGDFVEIHHRGMTGIVGRIMHWLPYSRCLVRIKVRGADGSWSVREPVLLSTELKKVKPPLVEKENEDEVPPKVQKHQVKRGKGNRGAVRKRAVVRN